MKTAKIISVLSLAAIISLMTGCQSSSESSSAAGSSAASSAGSNSLTTDITVISREDGSGTRGAFVELMGIEQENAEGNKEDMTVATAEISQSTSVVLQSVAGNVDAIGYISLGSLNDSVKAVKVDGVAAEVEDILAGNYKVSRPFVVCYKQEALSDLAADFMSFVMSDSGQAIVTDSGYISVGSEGAYTPSGLTGSVVLSGSTSVSPVMEKIADAYKELNDGVSIEVQQTGSGAGITAATDGACEIGMSSRELKDEELEAGLTAVTIANDGIAVIVNKENPVTDLSTEEIMKIYTGEITNWSELS